MSYDRILEGVEDPLTFGMDAIAALSSEAIRADTRRREVLERQLKALLDKRGPQGFWPHEPYESFPDGWYSAMDFASIALAAAALSEAGSSHEFLDLGLSLVEQMTKPVAQSGADHGASLTNCWLAEFAWPGMSDQQQTFVLNGALLAMLALEYYVNIFPENAEIKRYSNCVVSSLSKIEKRFRYEDDLWTIYMLNPITPNQTHYIIYEVNELDALYETSGYEIFKRMGDERRSIFSRHYRIFTNGEDYSFVRTGMPHPSLLDIYETRLVFRDVFGTAVGVHESRRKGTPVFIMQGKLPRGAVTVDTVVFYGGSEIEMTRGQPLVPSEPSAPIVVEPRFEPIFDLAASGKCYLLDPTWTSSDYPADHSYQTQGRLNLYFEPISIDKFGIFAIDLDLPNNISWGIGLNMQDGRQIFRYLEKPLRTDRYIVPISRLGFADPGRAGEMVVGATLYFYTDALHGAAPMCFNTLKLYADYDAYAADIAPHSTDRLLIRNDWGGGSEVRSEAAD